MSWEEFATAHKNWNDRWRTEDGRADWLKPEKEVKALTKELGRKHAGPLRCLDLGCGVGRHAFHLRSEGHEVSALDGSKGGIEFAVQKAKHFAFEIDFRVGSMTELPFDDDSFDYVLAWNVIYHGDRTVARRCIEEIGRVLRAGGTYQGTMLSKRNANYGLGREVAADTFVIEAVTDKAHPHYYCNARELVELFEGFEIQSLHDREHKKPGSWHWHLVAERKW